MAKLNAVVSRDLIERRGLQHWWIAEQIGINRRTLHRWLSGKTLNISPTSIEALAEVLACSPEAITSPDIKIVASPNDQLNAAHTLIGSRSMEELLVGHRFKEYEALAKGLLVPGLTRTDLGELYQRVAHVLMRQSKLDECRQYALLAHEIALQTSNDPLKLRAGMLLSYARYIAGDARGCLHLDQANLREARRLEQPWQVAANLSNLADQYLDFGRYTRSIRLQRSAIEIYTKLDSAMSLAFCHLGLFQLYREINDSNQARGELDLAEFQVERVGFKRGYGDVASGRALLLSDAGEHQKAINELNTALTAYKALNINERRNFRYASLIYQRAGDATKCGYASARL